MMISIIVVDEEGGAAGCGDLGNFERSREEGNCIYIGIIRSSGRGNDSIDM